MFKRTALVAAIFAGSVAFGTAQQPKPNQNNVYDITPEAGPWAICIRSFVEQIDRPAGRDFQPGELENILARTDARRLAFRFVTELRSEPYRLRAYMFNRGDDERKKEEERAAKQRQERNDFLAKTQGQGLTFPSKIYVRRPLHVEDQYIVLIGGYRTRDEARRALDGIKKLKPPSREFCDEIKDTQNGRNYDALMSPFVTSFVIPNPTNAEKLKPPPREANEVAADLAAMVELNAHNPFSPLAHQKKWTLVIKEYKIPTPLYGINDSGQKADPKQIARTYDAIGKQAESLAAFLHNKPFGLETYVIHAPFGSYVTVGIFNDQNDPRLATTRASLSQLSLRDQSGRNAVDLMNPPLPFGIPPVPEPSLQQTLLHWATK